MHSKVLTLSALPSVFDNPSRGVVPVLVQQMATSLLSDEAFMDPYLVENTRRLRKSYTHLQQALAAVGIPTIPAVSSIFAFVDLRSLLAEQTFAAERQLFEEICSKM